MGRKVKLMEIHCPACKAKPLKNTTNIPQSNRTQKIDRSFLVEKVCAIARLKINLISLKFISLSSSKNLNLKLCHKSILQLLAEKSKGKSPPLLSQRLAPEIILHGFSHFEQIFRTNDRSSLSLACLTPFINNLNGNSDYA